MVSRIGLTLSALVSTVFILSACGSPEPTSTQLSGGAPEIVPSTRAAQSPTPGTPAAQQVVSPTPVPVGTPSPTQGPAPTEAVTSTPVPGSQKVNENNFPLILPAGFRISLFTTESIGPLRFMASCSLPCPARGACIPIGGEARFSPCLTVTEMAWQMW
jgi:hypothetical protein